MNPNSYAVIIQLNKPIYTLKDEKIKTLSMKREFHFYNVEARDEMDALREIEKRLRRYREVLPEFYPSKVWKTINEVLRKIQI